MVHLFHTNDFHNGLDAGGAARLREARTAVGEAPTLLLDAGDAIKAGNLGLSIGGEPILETMSDLGYDAMTQGNRETHPSRAAVIGKIGKARFPVLCANVRAKKDGEPLPTLPTVTLVRGGVRYAIFGLTVPMVTDRAAAVARAAWDCVYSDPLRTAAEIIPVLRAEADVVIALTHIGIAADRRLAESVPGIDLIVSGHTHLVFETPEVVNAVPILQAGSHGRYFGHARLDGAALVDYALCPLKEAA